MPYSSFNDNLLKPLPVDLSSDFAQKCKENFYHNQ